MRILLVLLAACGATAHPTHPTDGSIAGLVRDQGSGDPIRSAALQLSSGARAISGANGLYAFDHVAPGRYSVVARFAGQPITIQNIDVRAGEPTFVDVTFTLGEPAPRYIDFADPTRGAITRYHPRGDVTLIEGTVSEVGTRERVVGAVVTAVGGARKDVLQTVTDEQGRYRFVAVEPGTYAISAYYSIGGRGQIEVRRSDIEVARAEGVVVPLWVELAKQ